MSATAAATCSQLSITTIAGRSRKRSVTRSAGAVGDAAVVDRRSGAPTATATASATAPASTTGASSTNQTSWSSASPWASSSANRDLPTPAGPTSETRRSSCSNVASSVSSRSRPTNDVRASGSDAGPGNGDASEIGASSAGSWASTERSKARSSRPGIETELVEEVVAGRSIGRERVRLTPAAVERDDQLRPEAFAERVHDDQLRQGAQHLGVAPHRQFAVDQTFVRREGELFQPRRRVAGEPSIDHIGERLAANQVERRSEPLHGCRMLAAGRLLATLTHEAFDPDRVDLIGIDRQGVAVPLPQR